MPQLLLPIIPKGATRINDTLSVQNKDGWWYYFAGLNPVFSHEDDDRESFRMYTSLLVASGQCKKSAIIKAFGVSRSSVTQGVKKFKEGGIKEFFQTRKGRGASVLTEDVVKKCQELFDSGWNKKDICEQLDIEYDTLRKAVKDGRIHEPCVNKSLVKIGSSKSERSVEDAKAGEGFGVACTRSFERTLASVGQIHQVSSEFENCYDLSMGGVLCSLPALDACGLYRHIDVLPQLPPGYYSEIHILTTLAFMYLCRIKSLEQLRFQPAGELGKQIGLDRIPEVKTMREKLDILSKGDGVKQWAGELGKDWMENLPDLSGVLFIDGHVSPYFGSKTKLPKRYVSGLQLCLSGTSFYYVNDILGQPFFYIEKPVDPGMLKTLENDIVPRLINDIPGQPTKEELDANKHLHRFVLVFDREGYSPGFFKRMWEKHRIACISYHKFPGDKWNESEFETREVKMPQGEVIEMELAERGSCIGSKKSEKIWVREVRRETSNGHQTSIISTGYVLDLIFTAIFMFSRWAQENFFKYMKQHFNFDKIANYETESIADSTQVINPLWKEPDSKIKTLQSKLNYRLKKFGALELHPETNKEKREKQIKEKTKLKKEIDKIENKIEELKKERSSVSKHIDYKDLPEDAKFEKHNSNSRLLFNTIKMIDYRAETGMSLMLKEFLNRDQDARAIIRELFKTEADIYPDQENKIISVRIHRMTTMRNDEAVKKLLEKLNETETIFPGTDMKMQYFLVE